MLVFLISCFSVVLISKSLSLGPFLTWISDTRLLYTSFLKELFGLVQSLLTKSLVIFKFFGISSNMLIRKRFLRPKVENVEETDNPSLLDLPELALDCILEKLQPKELCKMSQVCKSLRDQCRSDYLWDRHLKNKWSQLASQVAYREWKRQSFVMDDYSLKKNTGLIRSLSFACSMSWSKPKTKKRSKSITAWPLDSVMSWYLSLESGKFWFPAQVYNREHGHVGFLMSCYDAEVCYDSFTDTFQARYPPHGPRAPILEEFVQWERIRAPVIDISPHKLHVSDCLDDLRPGDHIEIQWRRNKEFPYGWWYGVVGHLETCDKTYLCRCHKNDSVVLEFNQYNVGSRWRTRIINKKDHQEEGNEIDGFYGRIRKIYSEQEISVWKKLWPKETLQ